MALFSLRQWLARKPLSECRATRARALFRRINLERIKDRLGPAIEIWAGLGLDPNWGTIGNWPKSNAGHYPENGDDLVFPTGVPSGSFSDNKVLTGLPVPSSCPPTIATSPAFSRWTTIPASCRSPQLMGCATLAARSPPSAPMLSSSSKTARG